jgi:hypothetical protein
MPVVIQCYLKHRMSLPEGPVLHGRISKCILEKQVVSVSS